MHMPKSEVGQQKRIRVYTTVEVMGCDLKRHLAVSELPDRNIGRFMSVFINIGELKSRIEKEYNSLYPQDPIEVTEILLNDIFCVNKDYVISASCS